MRSGDSLEKFIINAWIHLAGKMAGYCGSHTIHISKFHLTLVFSELPPTLPGSQHQQLFDLQLSSTFQVNQTPSNPVIPIKKPTPKTGGSPPPRFAPWLRLPDPHCWSRAVLCDETSRPGDPSDLGDYPASCLLNGDGQRTCGTCEGQWAFWEMLEVSRFFLPSRCFGNTKTPLKELEVFNDPHATGWQKDISEWWCEWYCRLEKR